MAALVLPLVWQQSWFRFGRVSPTPLQPFSGRCHRRRCFIGNRASGVLATVSATLCFDFFLTRPYEQFAITHRPDIETAVSLFVVGIVVTELAARNRHHHEVATEESDYVGLIYTVSELAASGAPAHEVLERVRGELIDLLHLRACRYESGVPERPVMRVATR